MKEPLLSVVMPTYNSIQYLQDSLSSLKRQTSQNYELLLCDARSTDGTIDFVLETMGDKVRLVSSHDSGVSDALNKGFSHSKGDVVCWLNSDDVIISPSTVESVLQLYSLQKYDVLVADHLILDVEGFISKTQYAFAPENRNLYYSGNIFTGSLFFSKSAWNAFPGFSCKFKYAFEYELTDFLFETFQIKKVNLVAGGFRHNPDGLSKKFRQEMASEFQIVRGGRNLPRRPIYLIERLIAHAKDSCLRKAILNSFWDPNKGKRWDDLSVS